MWNKAVMMAQLAWCGKYENKENGTRRQISMLMGNVVLCEMSFMGNIVMGKVFMGIDVVPF